MTKPRNGRAPQPGGGGARRGRLTTTSRVRPEPSVPAHAKNGNCWDAEPCEQCGFCEKCHVHDEDRGECLDCERCEACDAADEAEIARLRS